jgi:hypothetical protein
MIFNLSDYFFFYCSQNLRPNLKKPDCFKRNNLKKAAGKVPFPLKHSSTKFRLAFGLGASLSRSYFIRLMPV